METAVPGPFESKALTGTFEKDISCIQQNDIWSSETFNNFVNTVYKLFYTESSYDHIFRNAGPGVQARLLWEKLPVEHGENGESLSVPVLRFTTTETGSSGGYIALQMAPSTDPTVDSSLINNYFNRLCLVYGNGDLSRSARSYAMVRIPRESTPTIALPEEHFQYDTTINDNYCIIQCIYNLQRTSAAIPQRRRFHDLSELVLRYDRSIPADTTVITATAGNELITGYDVPVKYTLTFGKSALLSNFIDCLNSLTYSLKTVGSEDPVNFNLYRASLVGEAVASGCELWKALGFAETGTATVTSKVLRFVPVRPSVTFYGWENPDINLSKLLAYDRPNTMPGTDPDNSEAVFRYTGTYGFMLDNRLDAPVIQYAGKQGAPLVYIPNKNNYHHYEPAAGASPYPLPAWYNELTEAGISLGTTQDFSADYFFLPLLTIHEKYLEFAGMTVSLKTLLDRGETDLVIVPGATDSSDLESEIKYDSYNFIDSTGASHEVRKPLVNAADNIFEAFKPALNAFEDDVAKLGRGVFKDKSLLKTKNTAMALDRTLQAVIGLNWKLGNIIWIDPLLGVAEEGNAAAVMCDRQRKMYASVALAVLDDVKFGRGSLITPNTVFIHVTDHASDDPAYSNDPSRALTYQPWSSDPANPPQDLIYHRNMWREMYSEYLPEGCIHIALRAKNSIKVTDPGFSLNYDRGAAPLYIRLLQDPGLNYTDGEYRSEPIAEGKKLNHLWCKYRLVNAPEGEFKDIDTNYYPLRGQDFSQTSKVIVDDPEAGMRVVEKLTNVRIYIKSVKAQTFTYIPRTYSYSSRNNRYYTQSVGVHLGGGGDPSYALTPDASNNWRPENWNNCGSLDWYLYDGEVVFQSCSIMTLDQSIEQNENPVVKGVCISFLNVNPGSVTGTITCKFGVGDQSITIPAAGKLMLWRSGDYSCTAEVAEVNFCGKGGSQVVEFAPVAWPFALKYIQTAVLLDLNEESETVYMQRPSTVAKHYLVDTDTGEVTASHSNTCLCRFGVSGTKSTYIIGGSIHLTLRIDDRSEAFEHMTGSTVDRFWPQDCETRYSTDSKIRYNFESFIHLETVVTDCKLTFAIADSGNQHDWYPPNSNRSESDAPRYEKGRWQAFDPDLFLPVAPWVPSSMRDGAEDWPINFIFIDCGWIEGDLSREATIFVDCEVIIDQTQDAVYWMPSTIHRTTTTSTSALVCWERHDANGVRYQPCNMFFASRIFRKTSCLFYFASKRPLFWQNSTTRSRIPCSSNLTLVFRPGRSPHSVTSPSSDYTRPNSVLWRSDIEDIDGAPDRISGSRYVLQKRIAILISGLTNCTVQIPSLKVITVNRKTTTVSELRTSSKTADRLAVGTGMALFSGVSGSNLQIDNLDTRYPLVDEWEYIAGSYPDVDGDELLFGTPSSSTLSKSIVYWAEPSNGFMLFTYPETYGSAELVPLVCNTNNTLNVGIWVTRTQLSGIHGLHDSTVNIAYDFTTQAFDLRVFSIAPENSWTNSEKRQTFDSYFNYETLTVEQDTERHQGSWYLAAKRPRYWTQLLSDPGSLYQLNITESVSDNYLHYNVYLPCTPLFYLAEVNNCQINLTVSATSGDPLVLAESQAKKGTDYTAPCIPVYTSNHNLNRRRLRQLFYNSLHDAQGSLPHAGPSFASEHDYAEGVNARRTLRLAVGFRLRTHDLYNISSTTLTMAASCNHIFGTFTRVNLVIGAYNHVAGWCYELVPIQYCNDTLDPDTFYHTPYDDTDIYPTENAEDRWCYTTRSGSTAMPVRGCARRLWTLDNNISSAASAEYDHEPFLCAALSLLYATDNATSVLTSDRLPHIATGIQDMCDARSLTNWRSGERQPDSWLTSPSARSFPPVHWRKADGINPTFNSYLSDGSECRSQLVGGGFFLALDAYNTAELSTILIASRNVPYLSSLTAGSYTVPVGHPMHSVLHAILTVDDPTRQISAIAESHRDTDSETQIVSGNPGSVEGSGINHLIDQSAVNGANEDSVEVSVAAADDTSSPADDATGTFVSDTQEAVTENDSSQAPESDAYEESEDPSESRDSDNSQPDENTMTR